MKNYQFNSSAFIFLSFTFLSLQSTMAQLEPKTLKKIKITEFSILMGTFKDETFSNSIEDFKKFAPKSVLLQNNLTDFQPTGEYYRTQGTSFSLLIGMQFRNSVTKTNYKTNPLLRLGLGYYSGTSFNATLSNDFRFHYDTLTSSQTGEAIYLDSSILRRYQMNYSSEQLRLDGSLLFRTNPESRWSLFGGIGLNFGFSINSATSISYSEDKSREEFFDSGNFSNPKYGPNSKRESFKNKANLAIMTYFPFGIDFRIGKRREFWNRMHLFFELRPTIGIVSIPELGSYVNARTISNLGLKVCW